MKTSSVYFSFQSDIKKEQEYVKEKRDGKIQDREEKITWRQRAKINEGNFRKVNNNRKLPHQKSGNTYASSFLGNGNKRHGKSEKKKLSNMILIALPFSFKLWQHYEMPSKTFFHSHCILNRSVQLKFHLYYIQKHECGLLQQQNKLSQEEEIELDFNFLVA